MVFGPPYYPWIINNYEMISLNESHKLLNDRIYC